MSPFNPFSYPVMTSQLVLCKISLIDHSSGTRRDIKKRLATILVIFNALLPEKIKIFVSYTL